jgi:cellulose synthase/poly-beta-1,6-N-acetylglucosamine synthase-like glycosyltransferase
MTLYFILVFGCYFVLLLSLLLGWKRSISAGTSTSDEKHEFISVVVAMRNEEHNLKNLIDSISTLDYPRTEFEVILVDDGSSDGSMQLARDITRHLNNIKIVSLPHDLTGKKAALSHGISFAKGSIIATTDADCTLPVGWLKCINATYQTKNSQMAIGMVAFERNESFFSQWQAMEFASVIGTGVATLGLGFPTMCNGANLSFRKNAFVKVNGYNGNDHIASGDDEFLMGKILNQFPGSVTLLNDLHSVVTTQAQSSVSDFINQRLRWASKWKFNSSWVAKALAVYILLVQISFVLLWFFLIDPFSVAVLFAAKLTADLFFLMPVFRFFKIRFQIIPFVALQFLYPFYVVFIALCSQWKSSQWKGRPIT